MEQFIETVDNANLRNRLFATLNKQKPFSSFKNAIEYAPGYKEKWFKYKQETLVEIVKMNLLYNIDS